MKDAKVAERAQTLGIRSVPAVAVDGKLAAYCSGRGPDETADPNALEELKNLGFMTTPVLVIDGSVIVGFDTAKIDSALG